MMNKTIWKNVWPPLIFTVALLALWEGGVRFFHIERWMLPAPTDIVSEFLRISAQLQADEMATTWVAVVGGFLGVLIGVLFATLLHLFPLLKKILYPLLVLSQNIPMIALAPLLVLWFGFGDTPKLLVVALICFFPVTVATLGGLEQADPTLITFMNMAGASRWNLFIKLEWPAALPAFFSGLKVSATYSVMGAVIAEWLGAKNGLGLMMTLASSSFRTDRVFVAIGLIVLLSLLLFFLISLIEAFTIRWKPKNRRKN
jgi:ABC-type nitrate/sulfonate/bicarbonate transport system permease component